MLLGLVFRGVAFEFRWRDPAPPRRSGTSPSALGSLVAALAQGITLGALLQGIQVEGRAYAGGWLDWLTPVQPADRRRPGRRLCAARRDLADLEDRRAGCRRTPAGWRCGSASRRSRRIAAVSAATPFLAVRLLAALVRDARRAAHRAGAAAGRDRRRRLLSGACGAARERLPFLLALGLFLLGFVGLGISIYPYVVPRAVTIWDAAAPAASQLFMLVGARRDHPDHPRLHRLGLLGVPRQGRHAMAIIDGNAATLLEAAAWMVAIWAVSVLALGIVASVIRLVARA